MPQDSTIKKTNAQLAAIFLRLALSISYLWEVADRFGILGKPGQPHIGWGDWQHFVQYAKQVMAFLPAGWIPLLAAVATLGEALFGLMLLLGYKTRIAAVGSGLLSLCFAIAMAISFGIDSPLGYSVFTVSAASFLLATIPAYDLSVDQWLSKKPPPPHPAISHNSDAVVPPKPEYP